MSVDYKSLRIVFLGTPEFAVAALDNLVQAGCIIAAVITSPDKLGGRGMGLQQSAVKQYAVQKGLHLLQPEKLKATDFLEDLRALKADLQVVVAFRMLPELVWNMPPLGTINVHGSLLPQYRGAAPINWAVINGESETGVTTFKLQHQIDTGDILLQQKLVIGEAETAGELHDRMKVAGADLLLATIKILAEGNLKEVPQSACKTATMNPQKHAPKIFPETCKVDWSKSSAEVYNLIRGLSPYPAAFTELNGKKLKIFAAAKEAGQPLTAGNIDTDQKTYLRFACCDGWINIKELQLEAKKRMRVTAFLAGYRFPE
ncbi:MAG: methionyl-tRNA formyltransferase [Chitinophagaceae bacterium]